MMSVLLEQQTAKHFDETYSIPKIARRKKMTEFDHHSFGDGVH
jgi:hypothetical protein